MKTKRFDVKHHEKLNDPQRLKDLPPDLLWEKIGLPDAKVILDIGAGTGFFSIEFSKLYPESQIFALDISDFMIDYMGEHVASRYPEIVPLKMETDKIPLESEKADLIVMINLHHEIKDPDAMLKECFRLLRPGGRIAISDWKKQESHDGPVLEVRFEISDVKRQLLNACFSSVRMYSELPKNFLIIAEKPDTGKK